MGGVRKKPDANRERISKTNLGWDRMEAGRRDGRWISGSVCVCWGRNRVGWGNLLCGPVLGCTRTLYVAWYYWPSIFSIHGILRSLDALFVKRYNYFISMVFRTKNDIHENIKMHTKTQFLFWKKFILVIICIIIFSKDYLYILASQSHSWVTTVCVTVPVVLTSLNNNQETSFNFIYL